jgi:hypothetical protein
MAAFEKFHFIARKFQQIATNTQWRATFYCQGFWLSRFLGETWKLSRVTT